MVQANSIMPCGSGESIAVWPTAPIMISSSCMGQQHQRQLSVEQKVVNSPRRTTSSERARRLHSGLQRLELLENLWSHSSEELPEVVAELGHHKECRLRSDDSKTVGAAAVVVVALGLEVVSTEPKACGTY